MLPVEELRFLMERLEKKNRDLSLEIRLITAWIKEHRESRPARFGAVLSPVNKRNEYRSWRMISFRLHQRRSELKTEQEKTRVHLLAINRRIEEMKTGYADFPVFSDIPLETDFASVDACA